MIETVQESRPALDLTRYHYKRTHGDITVYGTWFRHDEEGWRPALVLAPTDEKKMARSLGPRRAYPFVIPLGEAWAWAEDSNQPEYAAVSSANAAICLGQEPTMLTCLNVASIVRSHLQTLLTIPPKPAFNPLQVRADVIQRFSDGTRTEAEIEDDI